MSSTEPSTGGPRGEWPERASGTASSGPRNLARQGSVVAAMTGISRITGFLRDVLLSYLFGASALADAFFVAFKIPNFFRRLFAEGAFSQAFVPILARYRTGPRRELVAFAGRMFGNLGLAVLVVTALGWLGAEALVTVFAPGFRDEPERFALTADLLRIVMPYLACISLVSLASSVLNAHDRFAIPAVTPVLLNLCMITAASIAIFGYGDAPLTGVRILAWGVLIAGVLQLLLQVPSLRAIRVLPAPRLSGRDPGVRAVGRLLPPAVFAASVAQINSLIDTMLASTLQVGSISWLYYADRLLELPVGLVAVTLGTILLPNLSRLAASGDAIRFRSTLDWGIKMALVLSVPAAVALYQLALPIVATVFRYGAQTGLDSQMAALALQVFAAGLVGWVLIKVLAPGYFAHQDTRTPFRYGVAAVALNIVGNLLLYKSMGHVGLALATAASGWLNAGLLLYGLKRIGRYQPGVDVRNLAWRVLVATAAMALCLSLMPSPDALWLEGSALERLSRLSLLVGVGAASYALTLLLLGVRPAQLQFRLQ
ncbi:MAG: murein biosynthesis integral membrane protein MurJ [Pseudomonadota bacterium]